VTTGWKRERVTCSVNDGKRRRRDQFCWESKDVCEEELRRKGSCQLFEGGGNEAKNGSGGVQGAVNRK